MSALSSYDTLIPNVMFDVPNCDEGLIRLALRQVGREFCERTLVWEEDLEPLAASAHQEDYWLTYDANTGIPRLLEVRLQGAWVEPRWYRKLQDNLLRLNTRIIATDDLDTLLFTCGTSGTPSTLATWQAIADGSLTVELDGTDNDLADLDFSDAASYAEIASIIQTALREAADREDLWCRYFTNHFAIWSHAAEIDGVTAGASGTDLSVSTYMNAAAGVSSGLLEVRVALRPDVDATGVASWVMDDWAEAFLAGAKARLLEMPRAWGNPNKAMEWQMKYLAQVNRAMSDGITQRTAEPTGFTA